MQENLPIGQIIKYLIYGTLIILLISLVYFFVSHGIATVSVTKHDNIQGDWAVKTIDKEGNEADAFAIGGLYFIPRSSASLRVTSGSYSTLQGIKSLPLFAVTNFDVSLYKDKNADKIASDAPGCLSYSSQTALVTSYDCGNPGYLLSFDPTTWQNREIAGLASNTFAIAPYQGGIIGIEIGQETDNPIFVTNAEGRTMYIQKPKSLAEDEKDSTSILTNPSSQDSHFLLKTRSGKLYYGDREGAYTTYEAPERYNKEFDALYCSLTDKKIYCYYGPTSDSEDSEDAAKHRSENPTGYLEIIDITSKERTTLPLDGEGLDALAVTQNGHVYGLTQNRLYSLKEPDTEPQRVMLDNNVTAIAADKDLYFAKENALYKTAGLQSYRAFFSENIRMSSVFVIDNTVLFNAYFTQSPAGEGELHTFQLTNQIHEPGSKRLVDIAPLEFGDSVIESDYYKKTIRLQIYATIISDRQTGTTIPDDLEYAANKADALEKLEAFGIKPEDYTIEFTY